MGSENKSSDVYQVALLVAIAGVLQIAESVIPHPIPGLRLGLSNVITLIALVRMGFGCAMEITILRTVLGSFIMGTFMSPAFILSFLAGIVSTAVMGLFYWLARSACREGFSIVGISILGALSHNIVQLYLAYLLLVKHAGILVFLPWLCAGAVITGWVTGLVAGRVCLNLQADPERRFRPRTERSAGGVLSTVELCQEELNKSVPCPGFVPGKSLVHRLPAEVKILGVCSLSVGVLWFNSFWFYVGLFGLLSWVVACSVTPLKFISSTVKRCAFMLAVSFLFPVFCNAGTHVIWQAAAWRITAEGLSAGTGLAGRILFLILFSALLLRTTAPGELARGMSRMLAPLKVFGFGGDRVATIFSLSWSAIPVFWDISKGIVQELGIRSVRSFPELIPLASDFITRFYLEAEGAFVLNKADKGLLRDG